MTDASRLDLREQEARIDGMLAETRKFAAEQNKLAAEASKFKFDRFAAVFLSGAAVATAISAFARHFP